MTFQSHNTLIKNVLSLSSIQAVNYIVPIILVPYLLRTIGTEKYGLFAFISAFTAYFPALIDYGFNLTGTRDISKNRHDQKKISDIVSGIISAKLLLLFLSGLLIGLCIAFIPRLSQISPILIWSFIGAVGASFTPVWYFQGTEKMGLLAFLSLFSKILFILGVFLFVKTPEDFLTIFYCNAVTCWIPSIIGISFVILKVPIIIGFLPAKTALFSGFKIFTTQFFAVVLANSNIFILGLFTNNATVAVYAIAEKIVRAVIYCSIPINTAVFPRSGYLFSQSKIIALNFLRKVLLYGGMCMGMVSMLLFILAHQLTAIVVGHSSSDTTSLIRLMSILPFTIFIDNIYGTQILLNLGKDNMLSLIIASCSLLTLFLLIILIPLLGPWGAAAAYLCSEICVLLWMAIGLNKQGISLLLHPLRRDNEFSS